MQWQVAYIWDVHTVISLLFITGIESHQRIDIKSK